MSGRTLSSEKVGRFVARKTRTQSWLPSAHHRMWYQAFLVLDGLVATGNSLDRKSTRLNSSHGYISYAVFCLKKKKKLKVYVTTQREDPQVMRASCAKLSAS